LLPEFPERFSQRRQLGAVARIENAADFLLFFPQSATQIGLADARTLESFKHCDLGRNLRLHGDPDKASPFRLRAGHGEAASRVGQQRQAQGFLSLFQGVGLVVTP
jgi:hypothetical protein